MFRKSSVYAELSFQNTGAQVLVFMDNDVDIGVLYILHEIGPEGSKIGFGFLLA